MDRSPTPEVSEALIPGRGLKLPGKFYGPCELPEVSEALIPGRGLKHSWALLAESTCLCQRGTNSRKGFETPAELIGPPYGGQESQRGTNSRKGFETGEGDLTSRRVGSARH